MDQQVTQVRAKFVCGSITVDETGITSLQMYPVAATDDHPENRAFSEASPSGHFSLSIAKDKPAAAFFKQGASYYLDITEVPAIVPDAPQGDVDESHV